MTTTTEDTAQENGAELPGLFLKRGEDARLRQGHLWVFSNEVDVKRSPLGEFTPGEQVAIVDASERVLGLGYINPNALICARMVERGAHHPLDKSLLVHRLNVALALREQLYDSPHYRLVFGESDGLPGLVIDRFGDVLVGQTLNPTLADAPQGVADGIDDDGAHHAARNMLNHGRGTAVIGKDARPFGLETILQRLAGTHFLVVLQEVGLRRVKIHGMGATVGLGIRQ